MPAAINLDSHILVSLKSNSSFQSSLSSFKPSHKSHASNEPYAKTKTIGRGIFSKAQRGSKQCEDLERLMTNLRSQISFWISPSPRKTTVKSWKSFAPIIKLKCFPHLCLAWSDMATFTICTSNKEWGNCEIKEELDWMKWHQKRNQVNTVEGTK